MHHARIAMLSLFGITTSFAANAEMSDARVNELIEQYIRQHPEVMIDSLQNYQLQEETKRLQDLSKKVAEHVETFKDSKAFPTVGNPDGDVTIVEFYDYNCPACKMMFNSIDQLLKEDKNVKVVFVEFPIFGPQSDTNAHLAQAVHHLYPDKYFDFHSKLMSFEGRANKQDALDMAQQLGMDPNKLEKEAETPEVDQRIEKNKDLAIELAIEGTPAVIVGTRMINSALPIDQLKAEVATARDEQKNKK
tara:strand:+ start:974 stop:1717 length:744 start_codon:yes stop_codon:yes gene_type:complete